MAGGLSARPRGLRARLGLAALAGVLVVAGCSGSGSGEATETSATVASSPTTVTASPSETTATASPTEASALPPLPEAAKENTPEGAEAFIRYYFDVVNQLHKEPKQGVLSALTDEGCESCANAEETIRYLAEEEARLAGDLYRIEQLSRIGGGEPGVTRFDASWSGPGTQAVGSDGEILDEIPPSTFRGVMAARWTGDEWVFFDSAVSE